jgi:carboxymethylenebutenolidase
MATEARAVTEELTIHGDGVQHQAWISRPEAGGRYPALVLLHAVMGPNQAFRDVCVRFAQHGMVAAAFNWMTSERDPADATVIEGVRGCVEHLHKQPYVDAASVLLGGYCGGGSHALQALARLPDVRGGVIFHGGLVRELSERHPRHPLDLAAEIEPPLIMLHGASDHIAPIDTVYEFARRRNEADRRFELKVYSGTDHAFTLVGSPYFNPGPAENAFQEAVSFVRRMCVHGD